MEKLTPKEVDLHSLWTEFLSAILKSPAMSHSLDIVVCHEDIHSSGDAGRLSLTWQP